MKIKYSPQMSDMDTFIEIVSAESIKVDGELYEFDTESVLWEGLPPPLREAHRENGELFVTVLRKYKDSCEEWDTGDYHATDW